MTPVLQGTGLTRQYSHLIRLRARYIARACTQLNASHCVIACSVACLRCLSAPFPRVWLGRQIGVYPPFGNACLALAQVALSRAGQGIAGGGL